MTPHPLWHHDIDQYSLDTARNHQLLQTWMAEINRDEIIYALTGMWPDVDPYGIHIWKKWDQKTHTGGPRATSSEERDS